MTHFPAVRRALLAALAAFIAAGVSAAPITPTLNYQGFLTDTATGLPIDTGKDMQFAVYTAATGGSLLFTESRCASGNARVTVSKGRYQVEIGSTTAGGVPHSVFTDNPQTWLEVRVDPNNDCAGFETLSPRVRLQAAPYAFEAARASTASHLSAGSNPAGVEASTHVFVVNSSRLGIGTTAPESALHVVDGDIRISTTAGSNGIIYQDGSTQTRAPLDRIYSLRGAPGMAIPAPAGCVGGMGALAANLGAALTVTRAYTTSRVRVNAHAFITNFGGAATSVCANICVGPVGSIACPCGGPMQAAVAMNGDHLPNTTVGGLALNSLVNPAVDAGIVTANFDVWMCYDSAAASAVLANYEIIASEERQP